MYRGIFMYLNKTGLTPRAPNSACTLSVSLASCYHRGIVCHPLTEGPLSFSFSRTLLPIAAPWLVLPLAASSHTATSCCCACCHTAPWLSPCSSLHPAACPFPTGQALLLASPCQRGLIDSCPLCPPGVST